MNLKFFTLDFKQIQKSFKPRKRRKNPKKEITQKKKERTPKKRKKKEKEPSRKKETHKKERKKKKIHSKEEDPQHTQIQSPSSTSRSSIYGIVHDLHHRENDLNKLHTTLKDVNDLKEKAMEER